MAEVFSSAVYRPIIVTEYLVAIVTARWQRTAVGGQSGQPVSLIGIADAELYDDNGRVSISI